MVGNQYTKAYLVAKKRWPFNSYEMRMEDLDVIQHESGLRGKKRILKNLEIEKIASHCAEKRLKICLTVKSSYRNDIEKILSSLKFWDELAKEVEKYGIVAPRIVEFDIKPKFISSLEPSKIKKSG